MDRSVVQGTSTKASDQNYSIKAAGDAAYAITDTDKFDEINCAPTVARTITLPTVGDNIGRPITIYNSTGTDTVTVAAETSTESIILSGGGSVETFELMQENDFLIIRSDGSNWLKQNPPYWHNFADPAVGNKATKTTWNTADNFGSGLSVTFSGGPIGTLAVICGVRQLNTKSTAYYRINGDSNISNTPNASTEYSHLIMGGGDDVTKIVIWLDTTKIVQFTVSHTDCDLNVHYPTEYYQ